MSRYAHALLRKAKMCSGQVHRHYPPSAPTTNPYNQPLQPLPLPHNSTPNKRTQDLQFAPHLALVTPHAIHDARDIVKVGAQLLLELPCVMALPQHALIKGGGARTSQCLVLHLWHGCVCRKGDTVWGCDVWWCCVIHGGAQPTTSAYTT